jgi:uncharacterized protein (UPF0548 family)
MKLADLAGLSLTYPEVGATATTNPEGGAGAPTNPEGGAGAPTMPHGYTHVRMSRRIGTGRPRFEQAATDVMRYGMLRGAGLRVTASTEVAQVGTNVLGRFGPFVAPCRVVYVCEEPNRRGFAYGSLPGHAVVGEEMFGVRYDPVDGGVYSEVAAFSRPATWWSRLGAPLLTVTQRLISRRYLAAV